MNCHVVEEIRRLVVFEGKMLVSLFQGGNATYATDGLGVTCRGTRPKWVHSMVGSRIGSDKLHGNVDWADC